MHHFKLVLYIIVYHLISFLQIDAVSTAHDDHDGDEEDDHDDGGSSTEGYSYFIRSPILFDYQSNTAIKSSVYGGDTYGDSDVLTKDCIESHGYDDDSIEMDSSDPKALYDERNSGNINDNESERKASVDAHKDIHLDSKYKATYNDVDGKAAYGDDNIAASKGDARQYVSSYDDAGYGDGGKHDWTGSAFIAKHADSLVYGDDDADVDDDAAAASKDDKDHDDKDRTG